MLHKYKLKKPVEAEQFDGSEKMMKHYGIHEANVPPMVTDLNLYLPTKEGDMVIKQVVCIYANCGLKSTRIFGSQATNFS